MSEYQYYEFLAIDRPLTPAQIDEVRQFSSRAGISATSFVNEYHWGSFKGDPHEFLKKYFDAMVYLANWGTRWFMVRTPRDLEDEDAVRAYVTESTFNLKPAGDNFIFDFHLDPEDSGEYDYVEDESGNGWMASLAGLRAEIIAGDYRSLYLAWLLQVQLMGTEPGQEDEAEMEPPVPPGLGKLSDAQKEFSAFFGLDDDLIEVAASASDPVSASRPFNVSDSLARVSATEKAQWLLEILQGDDPHVAMRLRLKLQAAATSPGDRPARAAASSRTVGEMRTAWRDATEKREEAQRQAAAEAERKRQAKEFARREAHLADVARRFEPLWREVDQLIAQKNRTSYEKAIALLKDMKAVSQRPGGNWPDFQDRIRQRTIANQNKPALMEMLRSAWIL